jgi:hypothetical protein
MATLIPEEGFRQKRAQQLCAFLFRWNGVTRFSFDKIAALLYLAERQSYGEHGRPLTYDRIKTTPDGPSLCKTLEMVLIPPSHAETMSEFSTDEIETIECALEVYSSYTDAELLDHMKSLKELTHGPKAPGGYLSLEAVLTAVGFPSYDLFPQISEILEIPANATSTVPG